MRRSIVVLGGGLALCALSGCVGQRWNGDAPAAREVLPAERTEMQTRLLDASEETVFAATVAVMQELGWKLDTVDRAAGIIRATTEKRLEPLGPKEETITSYEWRRAAIKQRAAEKDQWTRWDEMVCHIEKWPGGRTSQRITLSRRGNLPAMSYPARVDKRDVMINAPAKEESVEILLADVYEALFRAIDKAVVARQTGQTN